MADTKLILELPSAIARAFEAVLVAEGGTKEGAGLDLLITGLQAWSDRWGKRFDIDVFHLDDWRQLAVWFEAHPLIERLGPFDVDPGSSLAMTLINLADVMIERNAANGRSHAQLMEEGFTRAEIHEQLEAIEVWNTDIIRARIAIEEIPARPA
jgi:hypothetical protein